MPNSPFFPEVAETVGSSCSTDTRRDGQVDLALVAWKNTGMVDPPQVTNNRTFVNFCCDTRKVASLLLAYAALN